MTGMLRGQIWRAQLPDFDDPKLWLVVSHNARNRNFASVLAVRLTTANRKTHLSTVIAVPDGECVHGWVTCDSLTELWDADLVDDRPVGAVSPGFMHTLQQGLVAALGY